MKKEFLNKVDQHNDIFHTIVSTNYQNNSPFPHIRLENLFSIDLMEDVVENIYKNRDTYKWEKMCTVGSDFSKFGDATVKLTDYLISDEWVGFLKELTGIDDLRSDKSWYGSGINFEPRGAHLEPHTDFNKNSVGWRRVNLLLFLSKDWKKEWGGHNELGHYSDDVYVKDKSYSPDFNTAVIFNTSDESYHGFDIVKCPEDNARIVISCYYYSNDKGPHRTTKGTTSYVGWDRERKNDKEYDTRRGTGWREIK